ncbi:MAG: AlwI family type II restriction endonuclease [Bacteroidales bacterium]|nr:AlwI family type II restriction endonuclease [Bacteroidales bacterium]
MEGEPVSRHLGKMKMAFGKPCYCLFVAPTINEAVLLISTLFIKRIFPIMEANP